MCVEIIESDIPREQCSARRMRAHAVDTCHTWKSPPMPTLPLLSSRVRSMMHTALAFVRVSAHHTVDLVTSHLRTPHNRTASHRPDGCPTDTSLTTGRWLLLTRVETGFLAQHSTCGSQEHLPTPPRPRLAMCVRACVCACVRGSVRVCVCVCVHVCVRASVWVHTIVLSSTRVWLKRS
jgi:hypothetical protein